MKERFLNTLEVSAGCNFLLNSEEILINLYKGLGKERPENRMLLKQPVLEKFSQTLENVFFFFFCHVGLCCSSHFCTPIRVFIAFHTKNAMELHL